MLCPECGSVSICVKESRHDTFESIVRRRCCRSCGHVWRTREKDEAWFGPPCEHINQTTQNSNNKSHAPVKPRTTSFLRYLLLKQQDLQEKQKTDERGTKRSLRVVISVNTNERKRLCNAAKSRHTTISELIRQALVADGILPILPQPPKTK
jgi:transcriptional regulator NrdR family protein